MSDSPNSNLPARASADRSGGAAESAGADGPGVLAGLPRTRPQRASARRAAARAATPRAMSSTGATGPRKARDAPARPASRRQPRSTGRPVAEPAPRQGFEAEPDPLGGPVQPPGGTELVASVAELAGELTKAGVTAGARLVRDFLARLPG